MSSSSSSTNSPCAACKIQRRKCTQECVFAPYFPPDQPQKFASVHKVFGASNVTKLLNELNASQREDAVNSLYYEAEQRLLDPVYGCVGSICLLQHRLKQIEDDLKMARKELAHFIGPQAFMPVIQPPPPPPPPYNILSAPQQQQQQHLYQHHNMHMLGGTGGHAVQVPPGVIPIVGIPGMGPGPCGPSLRSSHYQQQQQQQQQMFEPQQQFVVATDHQQELVRFGNNNGGYEAVTATGFNQITSDNGSGNGGGISASLALGGFDNAYNQIQPQVDNPHSNQLQAQLLLLPQSQQQQQQQRSDSDEGKGFI